MSNKTKKLANILTIIKNERDVMLTTFIVEEGFGTIRLLEWPSKLGCNVHLNVDVYVTVTLKCSEEIFRKKGRGGGRGGSESPNRPQ